jgi:cytochrome c-type biogenesis protein
MSDDVSLIAAFVAGILSFVSPCVLPLVPGYLSFVSGVSLERLREGAAVGTERSAAARKVVLASFAFVLGFTVVFVALGASASTLGKLVFSQYDLLSKIAGVLIILFGLHTMGLLKISWLYREARIDTAKPAGLAGAFVVGLAFAFGWTPCIGPILGAILALAAEEGTVRHGMLLLAVYSLGLGIPFLATSLAVNQFFSVFAKIRRHYRLIETVAGLFMVAVGVLIITNQFTLITRYLTPYLPTF